MGETRADLHISTFCGNACIGSVEAMILTEVVANALDSRATRIQLGRRGSPRK